MKATKKARELAWATIYKMGGHGLRWQKATLQAAFYWPTRGFPDDDNAMGSLKAYRDGFAKAGIVTDDKVIKQLPWTIQKDKDNPRVEITISEVK